MHAASAFYLQLATGQPTAQARANHQEAFRAQHTDHLAAEAVFVADWSV